MISELDGILKNILDDGDAPNELRKAEKSFVIPKSNYAPDKPTVNLYLYDLHENRELRNPEPIIERVGDSMVRRRPPLRVDCSYMVTTYSYKQEEEQPAEEHRLLSQALLWLSGFPTIAEKYLPDEWIDKTSSACQMFPLPMMVAQVDGVKEPGEFWAALESPPRPAFTVVVTIAMDLRKEVSGPPVTTKITGYQQKGLPETREECIQIGGRVFDAADTEQGIAGAKVILEGPLIPSPTPAPAAKPEPLKQAVTTDDKGTYTFTRVTTGTYTVRVIARGFKVCERTIHIPSPPEEYEIGLTRA
jgi:hypothetical protein